MSTISILTDVLERNIQMLKSTLADFSDADMLVRPCPKANHAAWQLGHLINSETRMINGLKPGAMPELPAGFAEKFTKETASVDDALVFPKKDELLAIFEKTRAATVQWAKSLTPADIQQPSPEGMARRAPTVGHLVALIPNHGAMHIGQFQVIRRSLGKPILF